MSFNELDRKRIEKEMKIFIEKRRPPLELRNEFDLSFRVEEDSIIIFEIRPRWNNPDEKIEGSVAKATYIKGNKIWKIYWKRADLKWHKYDPLPEVLTVSDFLNEIDKDPNSCFWG